MAKSFIYKFKKNTWKSLAIKLFLLFITIIFLDFIIGSVLNKYYFTQESGLQYQTTYSIEKTTADLLIFGSSTAIHNYDPEILQHRLNMSYYNVGREGNFIFYHYAILRGVLKRYLPKMVIYNFDIHEFTKDQQSYDRISSLLPYYKTHPEIRAMVNLKSTYEKYKLLSNIYPYNSSIFTIAVGNTEFNKKRQRNINGYIPLSNIWNEPIAHDNTLINNEIDSNKIKAYESFIGDCVRLKVKLYIVCSPVFVKPDYVSPSVVLAQQIAAKYDVRFFDYSKDPTILSNSGFFADVGHLNRYGAKVFSNKVTDQIIGSDYSSSVYKP